METKQSAKHAPQEEIDARFDGIMNEEVKRDFAEMVADIDEQQYTTIKVHRDENRLRIKEGTKTPNGKIVRYEYIDDEPIEEEATSTPVAEEAAVVEETVEPAEDEAAPERKKSWREKVSDKLGMLGAKTTLAFESFKDKVRKHKVAAAALTLVGLAGTSYMMHRYGSAPTGTHATTTYDAINANPEHTAYVTNINVGGRGDKTSQAMEHLANNYGLSADKNVDIAYPAEIAPLDPTTLDGSSAVAGPKTYNAIMDAHHNGGNVRVNMFSQGTQAGNGGVEQVIEENGGVKPDWLELNYFASPNTPTSGVFNGNEAQALKPVFNAFGADIDAGAIPKGSHVIAYDTDFWANSGNKPLTTMGSNAIATAFGDGHAFPNVNDPHTTYVKDGITYTTYHHTGTQNGALRAAEQHGFQVTKQADDFAQAIAPTSELGKPATIDARKVLDTGGALIDDSARRAGIAAPNATEIARNIPAEPVQQLTDFVDNTERAVAGAAADIVNNTPSTSGNNYVEPVQQIADTVNQTVQSVTGGNQNLTPAINNVQNQVNNVLGGILGHK